MSNLIPPVFRGDKTKQVQIITSDPVQSTLTVYLKGRVERALDIIPEVVDFERIPASGPLPAKNIEIKVRKGSSVEIADIRVYSKYLQIEEVESRPGYRKMRLKMIKSPPVGEFRDRFFVELKGAERHTVMVPIRGLMAQQLSLVPRALSFGLIESGSGPVVRTAEVLLEQGVVIDRIESSSSAVKAEIKEGSGGKLVLSARLDPSKIDMTRGVSESVTIHAKGAPSVAIPIYGALAPIQR